MPNLAFIFDEVLQHPSRLVWIAAAVGAALLAAVWDLRIRFLVVRSEDANSLANRSFPRQISANTIRLLALVAVGIAAADVRRAGDTIQAGRSHRQIVFLLDRSRSMLAEDVETSRFELARALIQQMIDDSRGAASALVSFAGDVRVETPLTRNATKLLEKLEAIAPQNNLAFGSQLEAGLLIGADCFARSFPGEKHLIVLTDGESHKPIEPDAEFLENISLTFVAIGDAKQGGRIPLRPDNPQDAQTSKEPVYLTHQGKTVWTQSDPENLARVAGQLGGACVSISDSTEIGRIAALVGRERPDLSRSLEFQTAAPLYVPLGLVAFCLLFCEAWLVSQHEGGFFRWPLHWRLGKRAAVFLVAAVVLSGMHSAGANPSTDSAWTRQQIAQAYNRGVEAYHREEYARAHEQFSAVYDRAQGRLRNRAAFNLANTKYRLVSQRPAEKQRAIFELQRAIDLYRECIQAKERAWDSRANVQLTYQLLKRIKNQPPTSRTSSNESEKKSKQSPRGKSNSSSHDDSDGGGSQPPKQRPDPPTGSQSPKDGPSVPRKNGSAESQPGPNHRLSNEQAEEKLRQARQRARQRPPAQSKRPASDSPFPW